MLCVTLISSSSRCSKSPSIRATGSSFIMGTWLKFQQRSCCCCCRTPAAKFAIIKRVSLSWRMSARCGGEEIGLLGVVCWWMMWCFQKSPFSAQFVPAPNHALSSALSRTSRGVLAVSTSAALPIKMMECGPRQKGSAETLLESSGGSTLEKLQKPQIASATCSKCYSPVWMWDGKCWISGALGLCITKMVRIWCKELYSFQTV
jgi:hypothetical protein